MLTQNSFEDIELYPRERNDSSEIVPPGKDVNFAFRIFDSFKPRERTISFPDDNSNPVEGDTSPLNRSLKGRHLQFIAIGGSIGAGLFIGSGKALAIGGPAWLLIAFSIVGIMLLCVMYALGELAAVYPISGVLKGIQG
jgi:amino acid transporter